MKVGFIILAISPVDGKETLTVEHTGELQQGETDEAKMERIRGLIDPKCSRYILTNLNIKKGDITAEKICMMVFASDDGETKERFNYAMNFEQYKKAFGSQKAAQVNRHSDLAHEQLIQKLK